MYAMWIVCISIFVLFVALKRVVFARNMLFFNLDNLLMLCLLLYISYYYIRPSWYFSCIILCLPLLKTFQTTKLNHAPVKISCDHALHSTEYFILPKLYPRHIIFINILGISIIKASRSRKASKS